MSQPEGAVLEPRFVGSQPHIKSKAEIELEAQAFSAAAKLEHRQRMTGTIGTYRVLQELGDGGNSAVYLVEAMQGIHRGVLFALKVFLRISDLTRRDRFDVEIKFLQSCDHPSIMRVFDHGEHYVNISGVSRTFPFVVAEYLPSTLRSSMQSGLSIIEKTVFTLQLLSGLAYLAANNPQIIHRDIKPENIFVKGRSALLGDFGLLKAGDGLDPSIEYHISESNGIRYPRHYPTPDLIEYCKERVDPKPLSVKSDVFQLGLVIAELYTGNVPLAHRKVPFDPVIITAIHAVGGSQGAAITSIIQTMLEIDTLKRPAAADLFDPWEGIFLQLANVSQQLDGKVFGR